MDEISLCITVGGGRAKFMEQKLQQLVTMDFPVRERLEVCVTDGVGDKELVRVLKAHAEEFLRIKYARSHRERLPFKTPSNNPACDINAQICNVAGCEKIVRTDAEVMFTNSKSLQLIDKSLDEPRVCLGFWCQLATPGFRWPQDAHRLWESALPNALCCEMHWAGFFCTCFRRSDFIGAGGVDERFARGYGGEDTYFHIWWQGHRKLVMAPKKEYTVVHLYHGSPTATQAFSVPGPIKQLHEDYTMPLYNALSAKSEKPNTGNPDWQRPEMIDEVQVWC